MPNPTTPTTTKVETPANVNTTTKAVTGITVTWNKPSGYDAAATKPTFVFQLVLKSDVTLAGISLTGGALTELSPMNKSVLQCTCTLPASSAVTAANIGDYLVQVRQKATDTTLQADSDWGTELNWVVAGAVVVTIGSKNITLAASSDNASNGIYAISEPITVSYTDLKSFVKSISGKDMPTNWPNDQAIDSSITLREFYLNKKTGTFYLSVFASIQWEIFTGFTVNSVALVVKRRSTAPAPAPIN